MHPLKVGGVGSSPSSLPPSTATDLLLLNLSCRASSLSTLLAMLQPTRVIQDILLTLIHLHDAHTRVRPRYSRPPSVYVTLVHTFGRYILVHYPFT